MRSTAFPVVAACLTGILSSLAVPPSFTYALCSLRVFVGCLCVDHQAESNAGGYLPRASRTGDAKEQDHQGTHALVDKKKHRLTSYDVPFFLLSSTVVVYFPSCANRMMGLSTSEGHEDRTLPEVTLSLLAKAGYEAISTRCLLALPCAMPLSQSPETKKKHSS